MKSVLIDVTFEGTGIVNFDDSSRQMKIMNLLNIPGTVYGDIKNENFKVGKHNYYILPSSEENSDEDKVDTALREVAEGKLISEIDFDAIARAEDAKTRWQKHASLKSIFVD